MIKNRLPDMTGEFFLDMLNSSMLSLLITDALAPDNPIVYVNKAFEKTTGYSADDVVGKNCRFLQKEDRNQPVREQLREALICGESSAFLIRNYRKDGTLFWNQLYISPVRDGCGRITHFLGIQHDVTPAIRARAALEEKQAAIESSIDVYLKVNNDGTIVEANPAVEHVFGWKPEELVGTHTYSLTPNEVLAPRDRLSEDPLLSRAPMQPTVTSLVGEYRRKDGSVAVVEWTVSPGMDQQSVIFVGRDITEKRRIEREVERVNRQVRDILNSIAEGCMSLRRDWQITYVNPQVEKWLHETGMQLIGKNFWEAFPDVVGSPLGESYREAMESGIHTRCEAYYAPVDIWIEARAYPNSEGLTVFFQDISMRKEAEAALIHSATHDMLTGLMNRPACLKTLSAWLDEAKLHGSPLAVLFIDLDRFKEINDAFGHQVGDKVLAILGRRLLALSNDARIPARISGDEFIFLLRGEAASDARHFSESLVRMMSDPVQIEEKHIVVGASIGGVYYSGNAAVTEDDLINQADTAMYAAKAAGRHTVAMYSSAMHEQNRLRIRLHREMPLALQAGQFVLHYQPQIHLATGQVTGAEALIRWNHPELGLLKPDQFIFIAEESPLIIDIGTWIVDEVCRQLTWWGDAAADLNISINVSVRQLADPDLPAIMEDKVHKYGINPQCIKLEVTESMLAQDVETSSRVLVRLKEKGFRIALDDFGTGYSNFTYLSRFPVTAIKIDRSFIQSVERDRSAIAIINGIIALAKSLKLIVICEGVETLAQRDMLQTCRCDLVQGYLTGKPVSADVFYERYVQRVS